MRIRVIGRTRFMGPHVVGKLDDATHVHADRSAVPRADAPAELEWAKRIAENISTAPNVAGTMPFDWRCGLVVDSTTIGRELGYVERITRDAAIAKTVEWETRESALA